MDRRREAMKQDLLTKTQHSYETREDSGQFRSIFKDGTGAIFWKCGEGEHLIDIIPYKTGQFDPDKTLRPGDYTYVLIVWVHYEIGVNQDAFVCPAKNYGKPCPVCEDRERIRKEEDFDEGLVKTLTPKKRALYNIVSYDNEKDQAKGVQVWDVAHWFMERLITPLAKAPSRGAKTVPFIPFSDPEEGKSISFERKGTKTNTTFIGHKFVDRDYTIGDDILNQAKSLDELIIQPVYEDLHNAYYGTTQEAEVEIPNEELNGVPQEEIPEPPKKPPIRRQQPKPASTEVVCFAGGTFGIDCEQLEDCATCTIWNECSAEADKRTVEIKEEKPKPLVRTNPAKTAPPTQRPGLRQRTK